MNKCKSVEEKTAQQPITSPLRKFKSLSNRSLLLSFKKKRQKVSGFPHYWIYSTVRNLTKFLKQIPEIKLVHFELIKLATQLVEEKNNTKIQQC